jgi:hypothetical protein
MDRQPAQKFQDLVVWQKSHQLTLRLLGAYSRTLLSPVS